MSAADDKTFDVRTLERKLRRGIISRKDHDKYLKSLPDRAENIISIGVAIGDTGGAEYDDLDDLDDDDEPGEE